MKAASLFAGAGGLDLGLQRAGFEVAWAVDNWPDAVATHRLNFSSPIILADIRDVRSVQIPDVDVIVGGFPCQGFSIANIQRSVDDSRNLLYREFVRVVGDKRPRAFVAENVKGILSLGGGAVFEKVVADFSSLGYRVSHALLNAADYGVPQRRERVFIVGIREGPAWVPPSPTHQRPTDQPDLGLGLPPWVSVGEALLHVPDPDGPHDLENHKYTTYKLRFNGYLGHRPIDPTLPSPTITARGDDRGGVVIHHHPSNVRRLTARETALIQSFPIDYHFFGTKTSVYRQVANAVPPLLAESVGRSVLAVFSASEVPAP